MPDGRLLDEWLGPGFAVVSIGDGADRLLGAAENDRWGRLGARFINLPAHAEGTPALTDPPGRRDGPRVLIVRPDRFIFADISS
jgi:hypothetical protein